MRLSRTVVRLSAADRERLDGLRARCTQATVLRVSRADLVRIFVLRGLDGIDDARPIDDQLPRHVLATARPRTVRPPTSRLRTARTTQAPRVESLRQRIVKAMDARPEEVLGPRRVSALVGAAHPDTVRNALLVLAERGRIEKLGPGQYRARRGAA